MMREGASWKGIKRKRCNEMKLWSSTTPWGAHSLFDISYLEINFLYRRST
jgi:hypothetical protein